MTASNLNFYSGTPFVASTVIDQVDLYSGDGSTQTFTVAAKAITELGSTVQAGNTEYYFYNGGFTINTGNSTFTLATPPPLGTQIVAPGLQQLVAAAFDQDPVLGVTNPRTATVPFWLVDTSTINNFKYKPLPTYPGLQISVVQLISGSAAQTSWTQLASADASGNALTFGATGSPLYLPPLDAFTTMAASAQAGSPTLSVVAASGSGTQFWPGQYLSLNVGASSQEIVHCIAINYSTNTLFLDPSGTVYPHYVGELVFACGWKAWLQVTIPLNANNNTAVNLYNLGLQRLGAIQARP